MGALVTVVNKTGDLCLLGLLDFELIPTLASFSKRLHRKPSHIAIASFLRLVAFHSPITPANVGDVAHNHIILVMPRHWKPNSQIYSSFQRLIAIVLGRWVLYMFVIMIF